MALQAEEYGANDKIFVMAEDGVVELVNVATGEVLTKQDVHKGDIFMAVQTKEVALKNWVELAVERSKISGMPVVFWLDKNRPHDAEVLKKIRKYLADLDLSTSWDGNRPTITAQIDYRVVVKTV